MVHDTDGVGQREGLFLVMGDEDGGDSELALHGANGAAKFLADLGVQRAERLVEQEHLRLVRQSTRHGDSLLLTARELARQAFVHAFQRHQLEELLAPLAAIRGLHPAHAKCEFDVVRDRHVAEQRVVLEDQADAAVTGPHVGDVAAVQGDASVVDAGQAGNGPKQRTLAAA